MAFNYGEASLETQANGQPRITGEVSGVPYCVFRSIRPPIPTTCAHLFQTIRPPVMRCREAVDFGYQA